ncbi:DNA repair protein RecN [Ekhidna sp.]|jgi:DNA repair protein RecN (Recombination protein N)|uniref:DNA repair protein RecN n=1 Tax=Ekhidna sp. TaxID=2608089 RepID=UPI0032ED55BF
MIKSLQIKNYALIRELEMSPSEHLNIITGETGAGKSIMLGAVGLLLGKRADTKVLLDENQKCIVEGVFDISSYALEKIFEQEDLDYETECVIRREISPSGKSRAFVNDTPTNLSALKSIGEKLMDVHSQHESLQLGKNMYQLNALDAFAAHPELITNYQKAYKTYASAKKQLEKLETLAAQSAEDADYKQFLLNELQEANLDDLNQEELEKELEVLENAEDIKLKLSQSIHMLDESEVAILQQLNESKSLLHSIASFSKDLEDLSERMESASIELADISNEMQRVQNQVEHDPEKIQELKDRLDLLFRLQKKHTVLTLEELINIRNELDESLSQVANLDNDIAKAKKELESAEKAMREKGGKLTESRKLSALNFSDEIEKIIHQIGIENGTVEIKVNPAEPSIHGLDTIEMLFSANKGIKPQELKEVASGGEFSRLIFAVKYLIADKTAMPTIIFDEIDTGVSGEVALQMIRMMKHMAKNHQVISISHLPQFAAGGDAHYYVYKDHTSDRSVSRIKKLADEDRVTEIAKMIGGENPGTSALESAKELLQL